MSFGAFLADMLLRGIWPIFRGAYKSCLAHRVEGVSFWCVIVGCCGLFGFCLFVGLTVRSVFWVFFTLCVFSLFLLIFFGLGATSLTLVCDFYFVFGVTRSFCVRDFWVSGWIGWFGFLVRGLKFVFIFENTFVVLANLTFRTASRLCNESLGDAQR